MNYFEKIYPLLPAPLQNFGLSIWGLAWRHERLGGSFKDEVNRFLERDRWSPTRMSQHVTAELKRTLCRAFDHVPYYKRVWTAAGIRRSDLANLTVEGLRLLPTTPKNHLREDSEAFIADDIPVRHLKRYFSSGSTGTPVASICQSEDHRRFIAAREVRSFGWAGSSILASRSMIGGRPIVSRRSANPPFHRYNWAERQVYFSAYHIAPANVAEYVRVINRYQPQLFTGYAYSHYVLARIMLEQQLRLEYQPRAIVLGSEKLTPEMKSVIHDALGVRPFEEYGAVENTLLATECEHGSLHASQDFGIMEIVDPEGNPVRPDTEGMILSTSLLNKTQLLVRYEIGDIGMWSSSTCPCGRDHLPVVKEIVGRLEDAVVSPDGRDEVRFHGLFCGVPHLVEAQFIQETLNQFTVKVVARNSFGPLQEQMLRERVTGRLGPVGVNIERVSEIPRTERGKFRSVISKLGPRQRSISQPTPIV